MSSKDETVIDDWEEIDDKELDTKVKLLKTSTTSTKESSTINLTETNRSLNMMMLNDDDCLRTQYVPLEPTVKILKRPTNNQGAQSSDMKPKAPIKSLKQREQEYAEARLRILGSAKSEEDEREDTNYDIVNGFSNNGTSSKSYIGRNSFNQSTSIGRQSSDQSSNLPAEFRRIEDNVVRQPKGPDGSTGFNLKR